MEANNELKVLFLGSDRPNSSTVTGEWLGAATRCIRCSLGMISIPGAMDLMSSNIFPLRRKLPGSAK